MVEVHPNISLSDTPVSSFELLKALSYIPYKTSTDLKMPFRFSKFREEIHGAAPSYLTHLEQRYTRALAEAAVSGSLSPLLGPFFHVGLTCSSATGFNAARKLKIIVEELDRQGIPHRTRKRDLATGATFAGATFGLGQGIASGITDQMGPLYDTLASGADFMGEQAGGFLIEEATKRPRHQIALL